MISVQPAQMTPRLNLPYEYKRGYTCRLHLCFTVPLFHPSCNSSKSLLNHAMIMSNLCLFDPPFQHYAMVYIDENGDIKCNASPSILNGNQPLFTSELQDRFLDAAGIEIPSDDSLGPSQDSLPLEIGDTEKVVAFYETALRALQQLNCRSIAKVMIKAIEPRKQVKHSYNGGKSPITGKPGDPETTKPDWWPSGVEHKEPDHLKKPGIRSLSQTGKSS